MKVLAIDPGYDRCGVAVMELIAGKEHLYFSTCIETDRKAALPQRLHHIGQELVAVIAAHSPDSLGIETLFFNKNITTGIGVAQARGVILYLAQEAGLRIYEFGPQEVKVAVTGHGGSDKQAIYSMVKRLVPNIPVNVKDDEYDAIAVGITTLAQHGRTG
jgi:crossover junction endodeoxyribonuclease RuvC